MKAPRPFSARALILQAINALRGNSGLATRHYIKHEYNLHDHGIYAYCMHARALSADDHAGNYEAVAVASYG